MKREPKHFLSEIPKEHCCVYTNTMRTICDTKMHKSWKDIAPKRYCYSTMAQYTALRKYLSLVCWCYCCAFTHFSHSWNCYVCIYMAVRGQKYCNINKCPHCLCVLLWFVHIGLTDSAQNRLYSNVKLCIKCALHIAFRFVKCCTVSVVCRWEQIWFAV